MATYYDVADFGVIAHLGILACDGADEPLSLQNYCLLGLTPRHASRYRGFSSIARMGYLQCPDAGA